MVSDTIIAEALRQVGDDTPVAERAVVGGGSISQALRLRTARGEYLLKVGGRGLPGFFAAEAHGLALLAAAGAVHVHRCWPIATPSRLGTGDLRLVMRSKSQAPSLKPLATVFSCSNGSRRHPTPIAPMPASCLALRWRLCIAPLL